LFVNEELKTHLETSSTVSLQSLVLAEWNMNMPDNIFKLGNYRYRPSSPGTTYHTIPNSFDISDTGNFYTGATDADITVDGGFTDLDVPQLFTLKNEKMKMIYSLEDCLKPFRPRSGINKLLYFKDKFLANSGASMAQRPRYYMPSRYDEFKYWTSYRTENNVERGISKNILNSLFYIDDAVPFVVYKDSVPTNRIVIKMQTNVGDINLGPFKKNSETFADPFYGNSNRTTPSKWKIQYLRENNWIDAYSFNASDTREDGSPIIKSDGYVELEYGLILPEEYKNSFIFAERISSETLLPEISLEGYAYLVVENEGDVGTFHIWSDGEYKTFVPKYDWVIGSEKINNNTSFIKDLTSPDYFSDAQSGETKYRDFQYIRGIRIVVDTMNKFDSTFDLIEMSPRLVVDISEKVVDFRITKTMSDIGNTSLPVGQLLASNGEINIFDDDQAFNEQNNKSIISKYIRKNIKFIFYEKILNVNQSDYFVPIKTLYSEGINKTNTAGAALSINLRDLFFLLESMPAPRLLTTDTSLSYAITTLLDYIGFSNYVFRRIANEPDPIIPFFFIPPDENVAGILNQLAVATQTAMFFDEYNNFVVMSKDYMMPTGIQRDVDFVISGSNNQIDSGVIENSSSGKLPNIISIASEDKQVYNDGKINYTTRYIQRSYSTNFEDNKLDRDKNWVYIPSLLWEAAGTENKQTINGIAANSENYTLSAIPLNSNLSSSLPEVAGNVLKNNIVDLGEGIFYLTRFQGYFYSNGEIIKYDAAQYNVTGSIWYPVKTDGQLDETKPQFIQPGALAPADYVSSLEAKVLSKEITEAEKNSSILEWRSKNRQGSNNVWISSNQEYQKYFSSIPFNGKIYPTGLIRIYSVPYYETVDGIVRMQNGAVSSHGRGQFGTPVSSHTAGISEYWSNNDNVRGCDMESQYLFTTSLDSDVVIPSTESGLAGINNVTAKQTTRSGTIKNFMSTNYLTENNINKPTSTDSATVQSSALVMTGPSFKTTESPLKFVSYVYKNLNSAYKHFGTRMRIVGKTENSTSKVQTPIGSTTYFNTSTSGPNQNSNIGGSSGGLAVLLNPENNNGYYFEIAALTEGNIESYLNLDNQGNAQFSINNIVFYKIKKEVGSTKAIPVKLWGGISNIIVDDGKFVGQSRRVTEENPTVYDLSVEYIDIGKTRRFYLYINNKLIKIVDDKDPLPVYNNMALFIRGSAKVMFENIYALSKNYSQNTVFTVGETLSAAFGDNEIDVNESFRKYAMSGVVQSTYLSGVGAQQPPKYNMYFEEFGSIMRECSYFDIKYDRAYPALYAKIAPTVQRIKGYVTSGFQADSYGAEFLVFNATDTLLKLDSSDQNFLKIFGITFTQDTTHQLTVDEFYKKRGNLSDPEFKGSQIAYSPLVEKSKYDEIRQSRMVYGKNEFAIDSIYIQTDDAAESLMNWTINKVMKPRKSIGINIFSIPTIQLGDIVTVDYKNSEGVDVVVSPSTRFVVYNIDYQRSSEGPSMSIYLSEV